MHRDVAEELAKMDPADYWWPIDEKNEVKTDD